MKIYPNKSSITITKEVNPFTDIPLCYIYTSAFTYSINTVIDEKYKISSKKELLPYDRADTNLLCLFNKNNEPLSQEEIIKNFTRNNNDYTYIPNGSKIFEPKTFKYNVLGKKNIQYSSNSIYNMNVTVLNNKLLAKNLIPICADAPERLMAPVNCYINNGDLSIDSLTTGNLGSSDFTVIEYKDSKLDVSIEYDIPSTSLIETSKKPSNILNKYNTNILCVIDTNKLIKDYTCNYDDKGIEINKTKIPLPKDIVNLYHTYKKTDYLIKNPIAYKDAKIITDIYFNVPNDTADKKYINLFNSQDRTAPILIEENINKGFIIYIPKDIIENAKDNYKIIYETLLYVFFNAYLKSETYDEWITDLIPDFIVSNKKLIKKEKFLSTLELHKMFNLNKGEIKLKQVFIDKDKYPFVKYTKMDNNYLSFEKDISGANKIYSDPEKPKGCISIFTQNKNIIYFDNFIYSINDSIEDCMKIEKENNKVIVNLKKFKHSNTNIYVSTSPEPLIIPLTKTINDKEVQINNADYYLVCKPNLTASYFQIVNSNEYNKNLGNILATIQIRKNLSENIVYDMRQRGGGLPQDEKDNYACFDIGHIYGRPYRKAKTMIITLPKYLECHKDMIMDTIKQYCVAEDYPILIFKED